MLKGVLAVLGLGLGLAMFYPTPARSMGNPIRPQCDVYGGGSCPTATATKITTQQPSAVTTGGGATGTRICKQDQKQVPCQSPWRLSRFPLNFGDGPGDRHAAITGS